MAASSLGCIYFVSFVYLYAQGAKSNPALFTLDTATSLLGYDAAIGVMQARLLHAVDDAVQPCQHASAQRHKQS
jgi:hypothetical protein